MNKTVPVFTNKSDNTGNNWFAMRGPFFTRTQINLIKRRRLPNKKFYSSFEDRITHGFIAPEAIHENVYLDLLKKF